MYPARQRDAALGLLAEGHSPSSVSRSTGISRAALRAWHASGSASSAAKADCWVCAGGHSPAPGSYAGLLGYYLKRYDYPRWQFTNSSEEIRGWCSDALDLVGVRWRQSSWKTISVSTRAGVARLDELVGLKC